MHLNRKFFNRNTLIVAKELLGKYLVRKVGRKVIRARITETEAYCGVQDKACHASKGLTPRTKIMFGPPGYAYVYMVYGMYHCLNFVTEKEGNPSAVLIRGIEFNNDALRITNNNSESVIRNKLIINGPGKLCREFKIDKKLNGVDICKSRELWLEDSGIKIVPTQIKRVKRIGVDYAGKWKDKLWRFYIDKI